MKMPTQLMTVYEGKVCEFCPFNNMRIVTAYDMTVDKKKIATKSKCTVGYERNEMDKTWIDAGGGKKQLFVKRPQSCIDENGV